MQKSENEFNHTDLLKEIIAVPADKILTDRFAHTSEQAACSTPGKCESGVCRAIVE